VGEIRWLEEPEERAWRSLQMMQMRLNAELSRDLAAHSRLSYQDYVVLVALTDRPGGEKRVFELGRDLGWEKSRVSHQVARMAARGLVEKRTCGGDRRGQVVAVTARGREEITAAAPSHLAAVRRLFVDRLTPAQLRQLVTTCETVLAAVGESESERCPGEGCEAAG
jgi:DNA-binding MarR family transcriptional regulator